MKKLILLTAIASGVLAMTTQAAVTVLSESVAFSANPVFTTVPNISATDLAESATFDPYAVSQNSWWFGTGISTAMASLHDGAATTDFGLAFVPEDGKQVRFSIDLGASQAISQINTFTVAESDRSGQDYSVWGSNTLNLTPVGTNPTIQGWNLISAVDVAFGSGSNGTSIQDNLGASLGTYQYLLVELNPQYSNGDRWVELDVVAVPEPSSFALLGTALMAGFAMLRRKASKSSL